MVFNSVLRALPAALLLLGVNGLTVNDKRQVSIDTYITAQEAISIKGILANIGTDGSKAQGVPAGIVLASPSRSSPDCMYIGDLVLNHVIDCYRLLHMDSRCCFDLQGPC